MGVDLKTIQRRNKLLEELFTENFPHDTVKIIGNHNYPSVILNDKIVLSCYVHNFWVNFMDSPFEGNLMFKHKLGTKRDIDFQDLAKWYHEAEHREAFTVSAIGTPLKLAGYNFSKREDPDNPQGKYAVFAEEGYKIYFSREKADSVAAEKDITTLELEVV